MLNFLGYICSVVFLVDEYFFFVDDWLSEVVFLCFLGIKFFCLLMCYVVVIGVGNIK